MENRCAQVKCTRARLKWTKQVRCESMVWSSILSAIISSAKHTDGWHKAKYCLWLHTAPYCPLRGSQYGQASDHQPCQNYHLPHTFKILSLEGFWARKSVPQPLSWAADQKWQHGEAFVKTLSSTHQISRGAAEINTVIRNIHMHGEAEE